VGTYRDGRLVGGLWGLEIGRVFSIMSMFHLENHAGALALRRLWILWFMKAVGQSSTVER